ncbi:hypothetical protein K525DRAFT_186399 [Schizophyllum commune Loenen D]|nr:hypothetical protein K525DRAFT_186399 [Schizophyllum commune Loenen D]
MSQPPLHNDKPGVKITFSGAGAATVLHPLTYGRAGIDANSFHTPPASLITALPCIRGKTIPYDRYTTFCREWLSSGAMVFYAEASRQDKTAPRQRFALKVAFDIMGGSGSPGGAFLESFHREAIFYNEHLSKLQGVAVPKHYGVWVGWTPWDTTVACAIMEWGGRPFDATVVDPKLGKPQRSVTIMESIKALHDVGLRHNDLIDMPIRHILYDKLREKAFIIDFSTAEDHKCHLRMRMRPYTSTPPEDVFGCDELWYAARNMNLFGHGPCSGPGADPLVVRAMEYVRAKRHEARVKREVAALLATRRVKTSTASDAREHAPRSALLVAPVHE